MAQDRTHKGRVDLADGLLLEPMAEPTTQLHGSQIYTSGTEGDVYAKTLSGIVHQITPSASSVISGLNFTERQVLIGGPGGIGIQSADLYIDYPVSDRVDIRPTLGYGLRVGPQESGSSGDGKDLELVAQNGASLGAASGGNINVLAGNNTVAGGTPGYIEIKGGKNNSISGVPGAVRLFGGDNNGSLSRGGDVHVRGGNYLSGTGGIVYIGDDHTWRTFFGGPTNEKATGFYVAEQLSGIALAGYGFYYTENAGAGSVPNRGRFLDDQNVSVYTAARRNFVRAYQGTDQEFNQATWAQLVLDSESFDLESTFDALSQYRFKPNVPGYYQINWNVEFALYEPDTETETNPFNTTRFYAFKSAIYKNGIIHSGGSTDSGAGAGKPLTEDTYPESHGSDIVYLNGTTDYIELYAWGVGNRGFFIRVKAGSTATYMSAALINVR